MNKAFTKDDDGGVEEVVPPRAPLPDGMPNYVTPRGLELLRDELRVLEAQRAALESDDGQGRRERQGITARLAQLAERLAGAMLVDRPPDATDTVRFGATVRVTAADDSQRCYRIVGVDEADGTEGRIAFTSPVARALLGKRPGEVAVVRTPRGDEKLEIESVQYGA